MHRRSTQHYRAHCAHHNETHCACHNRTFTTDYGLAVGQQFLAQCPALKPDFRYKSSWGRTQVGSHGQGAGIIQGDTGCGGGLVLLTHWFPKVVLCMAPMLPMACIALMLRMSCMAWMLPMLCMEWMPLMLCTVPTALASLCLAPQMGAPVLVVVHTSP